MKNPVYRLFLRPDWVQFQKEGVFTGAPDDIRDGFIHFSAAHQVIATAEKYYSGQERIILVEIDGDLLGNALRWETSRGGALFPHLYDHLRMDSVTQFWDITADDQNCYHYPDRITQSQNKT